MNAVVAPIVYARALRVVHAPFARADAVRRFALRSAYYVQIEDLCSENSVNSTFTSSVYSFSICITLKISKLWSTLMTYCLHKINRAVVIADYQMESSLVVKTVQSTCIHCALS
jgi:hypothetical protein